MCAALSGVSRDTAQGVETCVQVSGEFDPSGTDGDGRRYGSLVKAPAPARVDVPSAHFFQRGPRSPTRVYKFFFFLTRMLGSVCDRQPTMIL